MPGRCGLLHVPWRALQLALNRAGTPETILIGHSLKVRGLAQQLRRLVREVVPEATEQAYPGWHAIGYRHPKAGYFCGNFPQEQSVRFLFEHGVRLSDPSELLVGSGKRCRHIEIASSRDIRKIPIMRLLLAAINH